MSEQMRFADFLASTAADSSPPLSLHKALAALWYDHRGDWDAAHNLAQAAGGKEGAWVHAYLHRKEGDEGNAEYWYRLASRPVSTDSLTNEWELIARNLLGEKN